MAACIVSGHHCVLPPRLDLSQGSVTRSVAPIQAQAQAQRSPWLAGVRWSHSVTPRPVATSRLDLALSRRGTQRCPGAVRAEAGGEPPAEDTDPKPKVPFGYSRKDVLLITMSFTLAGFGLKYGLQVVGVDEIQASRVVQLTLVLGLSVAWLSTYIFRVANKEMTYAEQLKRYEEDVMAKRLEEMPEAELETMLAQVEEDRERLSLRKHAKKE